MILLLSALLAQAAETAPVRVLVWDERQPAQKAAYPDFLGNRIAAHLNSRPGLRAASAALEDPEQGLSKKVLDETDVLVWWGHVRHREVDAARVADLVERLRSGRLHLLALHSAHWAKPFVEAMNARAVQDALAKLPAGERDQVQVRTVPYKGGVPKPDSPMTPSSELKTQPDGSRVLEVRLPGCIFPSWRADGAPSHVRTLLPEHPVAAGIPAAFDISKTEMYSEPFHVPEPDAVIFEERWDKGERFRSGCAWKVGKGTVFYFRPGHETYGVFQEPLPLKIVENAALWMGRGAR